LLKYWETTSERYPRLSNREDHLSSVLCLTSTTSNLSGLQFLHLPIFYKTKYRVWTLSCTHSKYELPLIHANLCRY
jgi:hypothetical protein